VKKLIEPCEELSGFPRDPKKKSQLPISYQKMTLVCMLQKIKCKVAQL
jgi:hypothetical protein